MPGVILEPSIIYYLCFELSLSCCFTIVTFQLSMIEDTVIIQILRMIQFNIKNSIPGIYRESNST